MDPLTITTTVSALIISIVKTGKSLSLLFEAYTSAHRCLFLIQTECTVLSAALAQIQSHFGTSDQDQEGGPESAKGKGKSTAGKTRQIPPSLIEALDLSLLGCTMTIEVLTSEVNAMVGEVQLHSTLNPAKGKKMAKANYVWREDSMNASLRQLRGQSMALGLLLKAVDNASIDRILQILESGRPVFQAVERDSASIRETYGAKRYPHSIANMTMTKTESLYDIITEKDDLSPQWPDEVIHNKELDTWSEASNEMKPIEVHSTAHKPQGQDRLSSTLRDGFAKLGMGHRSSLPRKPLNTPVKNLTTEYVSQPLQPTTQAAIEPLSQPLPNVVKPIPKISAHMPWEIGTPQTLKVEIESIQQRSQVPGLAVGVLNQDRTDFIVAGVRKLGNPTPIAQTDIFNISGLTETMTATVLARFVERGQIKWTDTIDEILPEFADLIHPGHKATTLEMFTAHLSGLVESIHSIEQGQLWSYLGASHVGGPAGRRALAMCYLRTQPGINPGTYVWSYANYPVIGFILEYITGSSWEDVMKKELFHPLEMYHTGIGLADPIRNSRSSNPVQPYPHYYTDQGSNKVITAMNPSVPQHFEPAGLDPAGAVHSNIPNMCIYLRLHLDALMGNHNTKFMRKESIDKLYETVGGGDSTRGGLTKAHRAWAMGDTWSKRGSSFGFAAGMWLAPQVGRAIISVVNLQGTYGFQIEDECSSACTRFHP